MFRHCSSLVGSLARGAVLATLALALAGCGEEPTPPRLIGFSPAVLTVPANEGLAISVEYEENDFTLQDFQWTAEAGEIEGNGSPSITYRAPEDPGDYAITVTVTYGDEEAPLSLDSPIKVTGAVAAEVPAVTEAAEPETSDADPTPSAEEAAQAPAEAGEEAAAATEEAAEPTVAATEQAAEEAAPPVEEAVQGAATEADESIEEAAAASERAVEEAAPPVEEAVEGTATEAEEAVEQAAAATERAVEEAAAPVEEGAGRATESVEETATATVAAIREEVEEAGAVGEEAPERAKGEVAALAEATEADMRRAVEAAAPAPAGAQAGDQPPAAAAPEPETEPEPEVAALTEEATAATTGSSRLDHILERHRLTAIVQIAFEPFSFYGEDGRRTGFEVDMAREFARRWLDDPKAVTFLPVPTDARIPTLEKGRADIVAAALTKTPERAEEVDFSLTYFKDGQRLLVPEGSAIAGVCDLRDRKVAAIHGSTSLDNIEAAAASCGFELGGDLVTFRRHDDAVQALLAGEVEAFTSDGVALANFAEGQPLEVVGNHFSEEPYGIAVPKGDARLLELVNHTLKEMEQDGTYAALYEKWFGDDIRPYPLEQPEPAATEVAALATTSAPAIIEPKAGPDEAVEAYVVQAGDTLSRIAGKVYGDVSPRSWRRIYEANREAIGDDPSRIQVGMTLTIPQ